jgi:galactose-3-O-sulfotransferase
MTPIYINIHIPKNAGQTFNDILARLFDERYAYITEARPGYILSPEEKLEWLARHPQARCLSSHTFRYPAPPMPGVSYRYLTFLRHPAERLVSLYAYEQQQTSASPAHSSHRPIEAWIEARLQEDNAVTNFQTYHLLGGRSFDQLDLEQARPLVDSFFFVGIVERFDQSLLLLASRLRKSYVDFTYRKLNVTRSAERFPISAAARQRLLELNQLDLQLYEYAAQRLERDLAALPGRQLAADSRKLDYLNRHDKSQWPLWLRIRRRLGLVRAI